MPTRLMTSRAALHELITPTAEGLWCEAGGFHIDPWKPVPTAVITHAHADHARAGHGEYLCTPDTGAIIRVRIASTLAVRELEYSEPITLGETRVSLHPAGHVLGSAQVRVEHVPTGVVWVVTGDYKTAPDRTCAPFQAVGCDVFLTESTFGLPVYRWDTEASVAMDINRWWAGNQRDGKSSVIFAYSLGKAQRVLSLLDPSIGPIGEHGAAHNLTRVYRERGVDLPETVHATRETADLLCGGGLASGPGLIIAPPSAAPAWRSGFRGPGGMATAFASGWMRIRGRRRWQSVDRGFVLSDHADWDGLIAAIRATRCSRVGTTHGYADVLARYVKSELGLDSFVVPTRFLGEGDGTAPDRLATEPDPVADPVLHSTPDAQQDSS